MPAHNAEDTGDTIENCIDSLLKQTVSVQIIIIDDSSTDGMPRLCEKYNNMHSNIIFIRKNNEGVSSARNKGLSVATGKYIGFVDSDDYFAEEMFEKLAAPLERDSTQYIFYCVS